MSEASADRLMKDFRAVLEDAEALLNATAGQAGDRVNDRVQKVRERAEETVRMARDRLASTQADITSRARETVKDADQYVRDNPWQAIGVAAGVAFLIGLLLSRR
jgi:ElaB/YqjD/DUF883 family membrane-anchored ribosome-binding protein